MNDDEFLHALLSQRGGFRRRARADGHDHLDLPLRHWTGDRLFSAGARHA
jgi:hypothetical protein